MTQLRTNVVKRIYYGDFDNPRTGTRSRLRLQAESKTAALLQARDISLEHGWKIVGIVYKDDPDAPAQEAQS